MIHRILPSRGHKCAYACTCPAWSEPRLRDLCVPGQPCGVEIAMRDAFVESARREFAYTRAWLSEPEFETVIAELAIVALQRRRLSARAANEDIVRLHDGPDGKWEEIGLAYGRYQTALNNAWNKAYRLLLDPAEHYDLD